MTRAFSLTCIALLMVGLAGAQASAKPMIAVLGLEVIDPSGTPSPQDTQVAKELTDGLRARAKAGTGTFQLAPGSDKELIDQKLMNNCDNEAAQCMSAIGTQLGADMLMFGKLQKEGKAYQVTLKVLDVGGKKFLRSSTDPIPLGDGSGAALQGWAKKIYSKLTGEASTGMVAVAVKNAERGTILIDGQEKGSITNGSGQISLPEGKYRLTIESDGFRRYEQDVSVSAGTTANVNVTLEGGAGGGGGDTSGTVGVGPGPGPGPGHGESHASSGSGVWKGAFIGSLVVAAGGAGMWAYYGGKVSDVRNDQCSHGIVNDGCTPTGSAAGFDLETSNKNGNAYSRNTYIGAAVMGVGVGVAVFAFYKGFIAKPSSGERNAARQGKRVRRERFVVTPVVSPDGGGATVRLDW